jgi:hypothetical protein
MEPSTKTPAALSTVYLDHERIGLMGDPRPFVAKIVAAAGRSLDVRVVRTRAPGDVHGTPLQLDDIIDRTADPAKPVYLVSRPGTAAAGPAGADEAPARRRPQRGGPDMSAGPGADRQDRPSNP